MPTRSVTERLEAGEVLLMDGGTGSELQRRGVEVLLGSKGDKLGPWSATANLDAADVVQQVHQDYLRVGADVIISNNFRTTRTRLAPVGLGERWTDYARAGGQIAVRARDAINPEAYVAGGMAAPGLGMLHDRRETDVEIMGETEYRREFAEHSRILAATGVDVMLPEFVNFIADCVAAVDACAEAGRPVWLGVPWVTMDGLTRNGESMEDLTRALRGHPVQAVLLMCSRPEAISVTLPRLRQAFDGPIGAYPNVGYNPMAPVGGRVQLGPDIISAQATSPSRLAEYAQEWIGMGAQIVGGCCATGPEHIMAMKTVVEAVRRRRGVGGAGTGGPRGAGDVEAIRQVRDAHVAAVNAGDSDAWVRLFADDAVQMPPNAPANVGRAGIAAWSGGFLGTFRAQFALAVAEVAVAGDWAFERGAYRIALTPRGGGAPFEDQGKYLTLYRRAAGGRWEIARDIWNTDAPPPGSA